MELVVGERVHVVLQDKREFIGVVLPNNTLKLDDGYNIGIDTDNLDSLETLTAPRPPTSTPNIQRDELKPRVQILHTGGTIASKVDYTTGGVHNHIKPEELLGMYPELQLHAAVHATFVANMSSDDMRFEHYNMLIDAIHEALKQEPVGIIITHGTDTLHYTAAALHYAMRGIDIPIVLVGSQRSSDRGSSDASMNLQGALRYIVHEYSVPGVYIAMHENSSDDTVSILPGIHTRKMHTSRRDAFKTVNTTPVASVSSNVEILRETPKSSAEFCASHFDTKLRIGMLYVHPHMSPTDIQMFAKHDALIIIGTGLGHLPITASDQYTQSHSQIFELIQALEIPVVMTSQCINGRISLQVYAPGRKLQEIGVLGHDLALTPEAVFIKMAYLLSTQQQPHLIASDMDDVIERTREDSYE